MPRKKPRNAISPLFRRLAAGKPRGTDIGPLLDIGPHTGPPIPGRTRISRRNLLRWQTDGIVVVRTRKHADDEHSRARPVTAVLISARGVTALAPLAEVKIPRVPLERFARSGLWVQTPARPMVVGDIVCTVEGDGPWRITRRKPRTLFGLPCPIPT